MLLLNGTNTTESINIEWNQSNFSVVQESVDANSVLYNFTYTPSMNVNNYKKVTHKWHFNLTGGQAVNTTLERQRLYTIDIDMCVLNNTYKIINLSYFNEINDSRIKATNSYNLDITDGTFNYNRVGSFSGNESDTFCSNLPPSNITYNWDLSGTFSLSKPTYITRIVDIDAGTPISVSNDPWTNYSLFLIPTLNSSTVQYHWYTTDFQPISGTMRIFQCNVDGTEDLVESTPIIGGSATANIELLSQAYRYDVVIGGVLFQDVSSFSACHVESQTEITYYVDVGGTDISSLIGLNAIECDFTKVGETIAKLDWEQNTLDSSLMQGCIVAYRKVFDADQKIFENCSNTSIFTKSVSIPNNGNTYVLIGEVKQSGNTRVCGTLTYEPSRASGGIFGISGLLASMMLVCGMILIFAKEGENSLIGAGIGLVGTFILGIFTVGWLVITSMISIILIVIVIGRYTRKPTQ